MRSVFPDADAAWQVAIMRRAERWLTTVDEYLFVVDPKTGDFVSLDFGPRDPTSFPLPQTLAQCL